MQAVVSDTKALIAQCSGLSFQFGVSHPGVPHVSEEDSGEICQRLHDRDDLHHGLMARKGSCPSTAVQDSDPGAAKRGYCTVDV